MLGKNILFDLTWDVNKYKDNYDSEHWDLCRTFMETHKTKYPEQKLVHLTEAFYQIGVYGSSYDPKTTRMVNALSVEVLEKFLQLHPGALKHPFNSGTEGNKESGSKEAKKNVDQKTSQSIWDVSVDSSIVVNVLPRSELESLLKGFVNIYDVRKVSTMNDNKVSILEESFRRSKFGPCHWFREKTDNIFSPVRLSVKWKSTVLAEAEGKDESSLKTRIAQALLSKLALFSPGIEAKWNYYRDGRVPDMFDNPNPRKSHLYKVLRRSDFRAMEEITSFIDTFANSDSFGEIVFGMDFSSQDKQKILDYIDKSWGSKLTHRTVNKPGVKGKGEVTHLCIYQNRTGEELRRWLDQSGGENLRYRIVPPGEHRRAGPCDDNVRELLKSETDAPSDKKKDQNKPESGSSKGVGVNQGNKQAGKEIGTLSTQEKAVEPKVDTGRAGKISQDIKAVEKEDELTSIFKEFVLFYDANKQSKIDKDDWFSALSDSFKISEFGPLEVVIENTRPLRTKCTLKWKEMTLASAEGLTETQAKTAATLQLMSKMEAFTYIVQAKDEYFYDGKVPSFIEKPNGNKSDFYRVFKRQDLPSYYTIFQTIDEFVSKQTHGEIIFGEDFTWDLKNEILVYLKAKGLDYRYFTSNNQDPPTHMAVFHTIKPAELKKFLQENGGENEKYKLIPPPKIELLQAKPVQTQKPKDKQVDKPPLPPVEPAKDKPPPPPLATPPKVGEKRKLPDKEKEKEPEPEIEVNKIQINLKKFKKDKVDYPEDTGGDFPGLILWLGITKNSKCQRSLYMNLVESFKMSKYGELSVEESEENVWGRKEPFKKCVIKSGRKVLAVGLGETKTEAKHSASLQVLRQLRKHCYAIQAKESYFKDGKAPPYDVTPDPKKEHVYRLAKKDNFKDRASLVRFIDNFLKQTTEGEVIFGDDFTYEEREFVTEHCNKINLSYRLMKCQSVNKGLHSHVAIYHQRPPPAVKAELMKAGGENDLYRLISPGQKITRPNNDNDMWPETLEDENQKAPLDSKKIPVLTPGSTTSENVINGQKDSVQLKKDIVPIPKVVKEGQLSNTILKGNTIPTISTSNRPLANPGKNQTEIQAPVGPKANLTNQPQPSFPAMQPAGEMFGPAPMFLPNQPVQEMPLVFGPQPMVYLPMPPENMPLQFQNMPMVPLENMPLQPPGGMMMGGGNPPGFNMNNQPMLPPVVNDGSNQTDLREELDKRRGLDGKNKGASEWNERKVTKQAEGETWSRNVSIEERNNPSGPFQNNQGFSPERGRGRGRGRFMRGRGRGTRWSPERPAPGQRFSPERQRQRFSPERRQRFSPERGFDSRRGRSPDRRQRSPSYERRFPRRSSRESHRGNFRDERSISRSPSPCRDGMRRRRSPSPRLRRSISPRARHRDLWDNLSQRLSESIFMYKYVKQDSTVETDPFALLRSTRSPDFNVDFDFISLQLSIDEWQVSVELVTDEGDSHPLVGEGMGHTENEARLIAARHAVDTIERACRTVEPNFSYFADGFEPDFVVRKAPMKTHLYEIIQNLDPTQPVDRVTVEFMLNAFIQSSMEDIFFLACDFSYMERALVVDLADKMNLWWRLFGRRHPEAPPENIVSTQHVCVFKQKSGLEIVRELIHSGGQTEKYTLVDRRQAQEPRPMVYRQPRGRGRGGRGRGYVR